jgi:hypothetical protein
MPLTTLLSKIYNVKEDEQPSGFVKRIMLCIFDWEIVWPFGCRV